MKLSGKLVVGGLVLLSGGLLYGWQYGQPPSSPPIFGGGRGTTAPERSKKESPVRSLSGTVLNSDDAPVPHAVVHLKKLKTLSIKTYIADKEGKYQFNGLSRNIDYEFYAESEGHKSSTKTLSSFDSRPKAMINLRIEQEKPKEQSKQEEKKKG
jgi:hypothetical protein